MADAPATRGETARVTLFTAVPKLSVLVVSGADRRKRRGRPCRWRYDSHALSAGGRVDDVGGDADGTTGRDGRRQCQSPTLSGATAVPAMTLTAVTGSVGGCPAGRRVGDRVAGSAGSPDDSVPPVEVNTSTPAVPVNVAQEPPVALDAPAPVIVYVALWPAD